MKFSRRHAVTVFGAATAAVLLPAASRAAGTTPTLHWTGSVSGDYGRLRVSAACPASITAIKVHVIGPDGVERAVVTEFDLHEGTAAGGEWRSRELLQLPEFGQYRTDVELTSGDGGQLYALNAYGGFYYVPQTVFEGFTFTPDVLDAEHRSTVLRARVMAQHPGTLATTPVVGKEAEVRVQYDKATLVSDGATAVSDQDGWLTVPLTLKGSGKVQISTRGGNPAFGVIERWIELKLTPTRLTVTLTDKSPLTNQPVGVSGLLERFSDGAWHPVAGEKVIGVWDDYSSMFPGGVLTDGEGRFSKAVVPPGGAKSCTLQYFGSDALFYAPVTTEVTGLSIRRRVRVDSFTVTRAGTPRNQYSKVQGYVIYPDGYVRGHTSVLIQVSADGVGGWTTLATLPADTPEGGGYVFRAPLRLGGSRFVRAHVPAGDEFVVATSEVRAVSGVLWRQPSQVPGGSAGRVPSPR